MALTDKLVAIAAAIREKAGTSEKLTLEEMPIAIAAIETGGGSGGDEDIQLHWEGSLSDWNTYGKWDWYFNKFGNRITTANITSTTDAFSNSGLEEIPFEINFRIGESSSSTSSMFTNCLKLKRIGKINNFCAYTIANMFNNCQLLRELPEFNNIDLKELNNKGTLGKMSNVFYGCYSLRNIPKALISSMYNSKMTANNYNSLFYKCYTLDEIIGLSPRTGTITSNNFSSTFTECHRLKNIIFDTQEDGTPYTVSWKTQTIDLHDNIGWDDKSTNNGWYVVAEGKLERIIGNNSGITSDKYVNDEATYAALKNDPDWFTNNVYYSRFNHTSAVNMINSLPDASAYLATQSGGTNTIKFRQDAGGLTDGGAIGNLTEEEIAVATAKGWAISYAV